MQEIQNLISEIPEGDSRGSSGKYESLLPEETRGVLEGFVQALVTEGKTTATANSYKSYVAKALALGTPWTEMTSDTKSAVRAFARLMG